MKAGYVLAGYYGFISMQIYTLLTFQAVKSLSAHPTRQRFNLFCKYVGHSWVYLGINNFSHRISEFIKIENLVDLMLF